MRQRATGVGVRVPLLVASLVAAAAGIVGTVLPVSGVVLGIPIAVMAALAIARGGWSLGDAGIFALVLGLGLGAGYALAAALDPDTGSYGDQGTILVVALGVMASSAAVAFDRHCRRWLRGALILPLALGVVAAVGGADLVGRSAPVVFGVPAVASWVGAWIWMGVDLMRGSGQAHLDGVAARTLG